MNLKSKHKVSASFSMSSMTDIIFLLLIFFMLTASFITPSGLPVNLPTAESSEIELQKVSVTITKDLEYFIDNERITKSMIRGKLKSKLSGEKGVVVLHCDASVPVEHLVEVAGIATALEARVSIATKPN